MKRRAFTLIEILSTIAIAAVIITVAMFFVMSYVNWARDTANKQTLTVLNDALNRYKCEGGGLAALTASAPIANVLHAMQQPIGWAGMTHNVMEQGKTYLSRSIAATGSGSSYRFTRFDTYVEGAGVSTGGGGGGGGGTTQTVTVSPSSQTVNQGDTVTFTASGGNNAYVWGGTAGASGSGTTKNVTFSTSGTYTVTVYNAAGGSYLQSSTATATINVQVTSGLVAWWKFDEGSGSTATDSSGNGNTGTLVNSPTWVAGHAVNALSFNGSNQYVNLPTTGINQDNQAFSVSAWINTNDITVYQKIVGNSTPHGAWGVNNGYTALFGINGGGSVGFYFGKTQVWYAVQNTGDLLSNNTWYHLVGTYDGSLSTSGIKIYVDGVLQSTTPDGSFGSTPSATDLWKIGGDGASGNIENVFNGSIDEVRIYNRELTPTEITNIYNGN